MSNYLQYVFCRQRSKKRILNHLFLLFLLLMSCFVALGTANLAQPVQSVRSEIRGVWMTNNDLDVLKDRRKLQEEVSRLRQMNFNTIYPVIWNSGYALYPSVTAKQAGIQPFIYKGNQGQDILADVVAQAHKQGLKVIPWFEFGFMAPPTSELAINRQSWLTKQRDQKQSSVGEDGEVVWLNPFRSEVQQFITNLVLEVVTQYDVDGIQFDDHMSLPNEFGYDDYTVALYKKESVVVECRSLPVKPLIKPQVKPQNPRSLLTIPSKPQPLITVTPKPRQICTQRGTPKEPPSNPSDLAWVRWRANKITAFMSSLNKAVKQRKPRAIFSVSPNKYDFAYKEQLQDWMAWVRQGIVDELIVQVYRPDLQGFIELIDRPEIQEAKVKIPTGIAILAGLRSKSTSMQQILPQVRAVKERNLGISFFYFNSLWNYGPEAIAERQSRFQTFFPSFLP